MPSILLVDNIGHDSTLELIDDIKQRFNGEITHLAHIGSPLAKIVYQSLSEVDTFENAVTKANDTILLLLNGFEPTFKLPSSWLMAITSRRVDEIIRIDVWRGAYIYEPHRPLKNISAETLSVFPGSIVPLSMGSHQRAFQLITAARDEGAYVDLLITGNSKDVDCARPVLSQVSPVIRVFHNKKKRLPLRLRLRRRAETIYRKILGLTEIPGELFSERLATRATLSAKKKLRAILEEKEYKNVIVNYAWMEPVRELVPSPVRKRIKWYCDTHDVQYIRNETSNKSQVRFNIDSKREKELEISVLNTFDFVIAISVSDYEIFKNGLIKDKIILASTGFDYALAAPERFHPDRPVFGFIGGKMDANVRALETILNRWWPAIKKQWPAATFRIAGAVTDTPRIAELIRKVSFLREDIISDGFVPSLTSWYKAIDVVLNPAVIQGGLNFKSIEAIMSGKLLVTSTLGSACLGDKRLSIASDNVDEIVEKIRNSISDQNYFIEERARTILIAKDLFGNAISYKALFDSLILASAQQVDVSASSPSSTSAQRVLIQCGDHLENRERVLPLAIAVREKGHHPVVLVYSRELIKPFLAYGIDAIALFDFNETPTERLGRAARTFRFRRGRALSIPYRGFDLGAISYVDQMQKPLRYGLTERKEALSRISRDVDRILRVINYVKPDQLYIWNGYTGYVANCLRYYGLVNNKKTLFLERSLFQDGLFVDPRGSNGSSELSQLSSRVIYSYRPRGSAVRPMNAAKGVVEKEDIDLLRNAGDWRDANTIIFVPLQVQSDTNILLYSHEVKTMASFVKLVHDRYYRPGVFIIVRPHPEETLKDLAIPKLPGVYVDSRGSMWGWLSLADLVVSINSTVGLQGLIMGKPVVSLGRSIYDGKDLTGKSSPDPASLQIYWNVLVDRYTCLPEKPPAILDELLPTVEKNRLTYINRFGIDVQEALKRTSAWRKEVEEIAFKHGKLCIGYNISSTDLVNLTYRNTSSPITAEYIKLCARKALSISESCALNFSRDVKQDKSDIFISRTDQGEIRKNTVDRYFWPLPETIAGRESGSNM